MEKLLKPIKQVLKKQMPKSKGTPDSFEVAPHRSDQHQGENLILRFMRGLITIQMERLTPLSFWTTLLFMVFVIFMMKYCSEVMVAFLHAIKEIRGFIK